jgi:glutamate dehydrogenase (NAD(P)+)
MVNLFDIAVDQINEAAELLALDSATRALLCRPRREYHFTLPVQMDDGSFDVYPGFRIQYNDARGPTYGSVRFHPDETANKARARAAWMTWKPAIMDLPLGGAYGGIICDPEGLSARELERLARSYVRALGSFTNGERDIIAPDAFSTPKTISWMADERSVIRNNAFVSPGCQSLSEFDGTLAGNDGYAKSGLFCLREGAKYSNVELKNGRTVIFGFNETGMNVAKLSERYFGCRVIAVSDPPNGIRYLNGLDVTELIRYKQTTGSLAGFPGAEEVVPQEVLESECEVLWVTDGEAAVTPDNADGIKARIIVEATDGAITPAADKILHGRGVFVIPDVLSNAGGVIASYYGWAVIPGDDRAFGKMDMFLDDRTTKTFHRVLEERNARNIHMRLAAYSLGVERVVDAMKIRGWC